MSQIRNAVLVDLDSLNVVFKQGERFVSVLSYADAVERLSEVVPCLGPGYNVYLCMKPREPMTGDVIIDELAIPGLPFTANSEELRSVLKFFRNCHGVSDVYLCNWLHNYIAQARVATFESVFYYGKGVAYLGVSDRAVEEFRWFESRRDFDDKKYLTEDTYGDLGLLDVDGFIAQYPEFAAASRAQLTAIMPLVHCYKTSACLNTDSLYDSLQSMNAGETLRAKAEELPDPAPASLPDDPALAPKAFEVSKTAMPTEENAPEELDIVRREKVKTSTPFLSKVLVVAACFLAVFFGGTAGIVLRGPAVAVDDKYFAETNHRILELENVEEIYANSLVRSQAMFDAFKYCKNAEIDLTIVGFDATLTNYTVRYNCVSEAESAEFLEYLALNYSVESSSDLGATAVNGEPMLQFSVMFR